MCDTETLKDLQRTTNKVIDGLRGSDVPGPVNWGDLKCNNAESWCDVYGDNGLRVTIDEASPDANEFKKAVSDGLVAAGWVGVEVVTEW